MGRDRNRGRYRVILASMRYLERHDGLPQMGVVEVGERCPSTSPMVFSGTAPRRTCRPRMPQGVRTALARRDRVGIDEVPCDNLVQRRRATEQVVWRQGS
jgi:hypothetical protein